MIASLSCSKLVGCIGTVQLVYLIKWLVSVEMIAPYSFGYMMEMGAKSLVQTKAIKVLKCVMW